MNHLLTGLPVWSLVSLTSMLNTRARTTHLLLAAHGANHVCLLSYTEILAMAESVLLIFRALMFMLDYPGVQKVFAC